MPHRVLAILLSTLIVLSVFFGVASAGLFLLGGTLSNQSAGPISEEPLSVLNWIVGGTLFLIITDVLLLIGTLAFIQLQRNDQS